MILRAVFPALAASLAVVAGCKKAEVQSYRVAKEPVAEMPAAQATGAAPAAPASGGSTMANTPVPTASGADLTWSVPPGWKNEPGSSMRKGSYAVTGDGGKAVIAVTAFPGNVGGDLANLNRWRGQINLPPVSQAEFESNVQRLERNGLKMIVVDAAGKGADGKPERILGAMVPHAGATWFFKMQGPDALVAKEKPAFMALLDTVKAGGAAK